METKGPVRIAVLASGGGTTLQNLIDRIADGRLWAHIVLVASNNPKAFVLERGRKAGLQTVEVERRGASRDEFSSRLFEHCRNAGADLVCMAGFLQLLHV